jgi:asparagine synthase (glutamine-hydrolysing)
MLACLDHRGTPIDSPIELAHATAAVCVGDNEPRIGVVQTGHFSQMKCSWATAGHLFCELPEDASFESLCSMRGSFAIACIDDDGLLVARDPLGCHGVYYGRVDGEWLIASEPKAITSDPKFTRTICPAAVALYLSCSFVPGGGTMLEGLFELQAGHVAIFRSGQEPVIRCYFEFEQDEYDPDTAACSSDQYWIGRTRETIERAVAERMPDEPPAVFLSGGLDSSIVAAEVARQCDRPIETFTIHFGKKYHHELDYARAVAERIGSRHHEIEIKPRCFLSRFREMVWHLDDPIGDPITQPNFELARIVGERFGSVFNGEGGDPLFGGPKNIGMMLNHWYGLDREPNFRERAYLESYRRAWTELELLLSDDFKKEIHFADDVESVFKPMLNGDRPASFLNKLMAINIRFKGANLILPKVDRMLAAHSVVPLSPLFDDQLTKLSFEMPPLMKLRSGVEKYVLKRAYEDELPASVIKRPKSGMRVPVHYWMQREMRRFSKKMLARKRLSRSGIFNPDRVKQMLRYETEQANGRYGLRLWMLLTFEVWREIVVEQKRGF